MHAQFLRENKTYSVIMSNDSFAQNHLEKYGWKRGKGLGRNESGITDAIKPKLKFDTAGVGHDAGEQFTFHWWDHVFNKAAKNIVVENHEDGVQVKQKGTNDKLISNKRSSGVKTSKPLMYGSFVKSGTLTSDGKISQDDSPSSSSSSDEEDEVPESYEGNDEKLFKACGGRTAHKGARHGLLLTGKLKRIQEQDDLHGNNKKRVKYSSSTVPVTVENSSIDKDQSNRNDRYTERTEEQQISEMNTCDKEVIICKLKDPLIQKKKKSTKNKRKHCEPDLCDSANTYGDTNCVLVEDKGDIHNKVEEVSRKLSKCKKSKKNRTNHFEKYTNTSHAADVQDAGENTLLLEKEMDDVDEEQLCNLVKKHKKSKRKKRCRNEGLHQNGEENAVNGNINSSDVPLQNNDCEAVSHSPAKSKKKKKNKSRNLDDQQTESMQVNGALSDSKIYEKNGNVDDDGKNETVGKGLKKKKKEQKEQAAFMTEVKCR